MHAAERAPVVADDGTTPDVAVMSRQEFLRAWKYSGGQHLTMIGPTQRGKTTFGLELLDRSISPEHKAVILAGKPPDRDATMNAAAKKLNLRVVDEWPPTPSPMDRYKKRRGYVLRPEQSLTNLDADEANVKRQFKSALLSNYRSKVPVITFVDEAHFVQKDLGLKREVEAPLMRGAPHNGVWSLIQRGRYVSYLCYDAPEHIFIFHDPDRANQRRYSEIGGVDPDFLLRLSGTLKTYSTPNGQTISECIYIRRSGPFVCVVGVD